MDGWCRRRGNKIQSGTSVHSEPMVLPLAEPHLYTNDLIWDVAYPPIGASNYHLRPGGWLIAILVRKLSPCYDELSFELSDDNYYPLYTSFSISPIMDRGGVMLSAPIPNVNARAMYCLMIPVTETGLEIVTINRQSV